MAKQIPNILTVIRFFLIPVIIVQIMKEHYIVAFLFLTLSGLTDILDGYIARKFNFITDFGKLIDPLADKATQISILTLLTLSKIIPTWILIIVVLKEFILIAGASFLYGKDFVVSSKWYGKLATVLFYIAIVVSLFIKEINSSNYSFSPLPPFDQYLYYFALIATMFSLLMYLKAFYDQGYLSNLKQKGNSK